VPSASFDRFRALVVGDESLQGRLRGGQDWDCFSALCTSLAADLGCALAPGDLDAARAAAHRSRLEPRPPDDTRSEALEAAAPSGWTPVDFNSADRNVQWCDLRGVAFEDPSFQGTVRRASRDHYRLLFRARTGLAALADAAARDRPLEPAGFIFHASRCGSTLVCRMLVELADTVVLSEPGVVDQVLRATGVDDATRQHWLASMIGALTQGRAPGERRAVIKFDAWSVRDLPLIRRAFPDTPWVFLYRDPASVVASQCHLPGMPGAPGLLPPELFGLDLAGALALAREEYCAKVIGTVCEDALAELDNGGRVIAYDELPEAVWRQIMPHFGIAAQREDRARMRVAAELDSKRPYQRFDAAAPTHEVTPAMRAASDRFAGAAYARLETHRASQGDLRSVPC